jgi:cyanobactin maturation PatA/PatG family protease
LPALASIPGVAELWRRTEGSPEVSVGVIDAGPFDLSHTAFEGADVTVAEPYWLRRDDPHERYAEHATVSASVLFGRRDGPVPGMAPGCRGVLVPAYSDPSFARDPVALSRALDICLDAGTDVICIQFCHPTDSGHADGQLEHTLRRATEQRTLVVACAGNDGGRRLCHPAAHPEVLAAGAHDDDGRVCDFSNWGPALRDHGIVAPGTNVLGAVPGGGTVTRKGTSVATPIVGGIVALLLSLLRDAGHDADPLAVRDALLASARPCTADEVDGEPGRCLAGKLDVPGATRLVLEPAPAPRWHPQGWRPRLAGAEPVLAFADSDDDGSAAGPSATAEPAPATAFATQSTAPPRDVSADGVVVSAPNGSGVQPPVYALGTLGYDFGSDARRDSFKQLMAPIEVDGTVVPANPFDSRQMVDHLTAHPSEALSLIWTLNMELTPIYAIEARGPFAASVYELLTRLLAGEVAGSADPAYVERVAIPGRLPGRTLKLHNGQLVPVIDCQQLRGLYGWEVNKLVSAAVGAARDAPGVTADEVVAANLREFLTKVYYDLRNLGTTSADRALNFAATNAFQAAHVFAGALAEGRVLDTIFVEKSPFCRLDSDCWDVRLRFFDPENDRRARRVFRFTIDVSDVMPVTLGDVRTWTEAT